MRAAGHGFEQLEPRWSEAVARHQAAIDAFVAAAAAVNESDWYRPVDDGKWTPAQITEHVVVAYETLVREVCGGEGLRVQTGWLLRTVLRTTVLPSIMRRRALPRGAKAPRALKPGAVDTPREEALGRLRAVSDKLVREIVERRGERDLRLTHHLFGSVRPLKGIDFVAIHTEHHARQLAALAREP